MHLAAVQATCHTHTYTHTYNHTDIHTHTHTYIHTHIQSHRHTYTHTYIHTPFLNGVLQKIKDDSFDFESKFKEVIDNCATVVFYYCTGFASM